ncbi:MAG: glycosyltransferase family 4 protein [Clostridia bacterium]|nr:glycosyltransferase family 4 protein [Clostridia bacterium]
MKILLVCSKSSVVVNFRKRLIEKLQALGHNVCALAFDNEHEETIKERNIEFHYFNDANRSLNPFKVLSLKNRYAKAIKEINPDLVFTFMLKPNIYGVQGAKKAGFTNIYSMVEGAGDVFIYNSLKWKLIRKYVCHGYKKAFKNSKKVFFLNSDDKKDFVKRGLVKDEQCELIHGIGIDIEHFEYQPVENKQTFLMIARLLHTKGVFEYCESAKIVKEKYPNATFNIVGPEGTIKAEDLKSYTETGIINYLGATTDVRPFIKDCGIYVLPSYREGFSVSIMEAQAVGRAVITGDTNGTRDAVDDGYNGFLVQIKNSEALAEKMIYFLENQDMVTKMGNNARKRAEESFDHRVINEKICKIIGV